MMKKYFIPIICLTVLSGCFHDPVKPNEDAMNDKIKELNAYRNAASARCSGASYGYALGKSSSVTLAGEAAISEKLLKKGYGTGSLDIGVTLQDKTELASILGNLTNEQVERFLNKYQGCMNDEMEPFYKVIGLSYPEKPKVKPVEKKIELEARRTYTGVTGCNENRSRDIAIIACNERAKDYAHQNNTNLIISNMIGFTHDIKRYQEPWPSNARSCQTEVIVRCLATVINKK